MKEGRQIAVAPNSSGHGAEFLSGGCNNLFNMLTQKDIIAIFIHVLFPFFSKSLQAFMWHHRR